MEESQIGYQRKRQEKLVFCEESSDSSDDNDISISSLAVTTQKVDSNTSASKTVHEKSAPKLDETVSVKRHHCDDDVHLQIRHKLQKSSGYKPDLSKLPKPPEEEFFKPDMNFSADDKKRIMEQAPIIFENRVGPNVNPEQARRAQKATFNKMLARSCGRSRKSTY